MNLIKNNLIRNENIKLDDKVFGPDVCTIQEKTTRRSPLLVIEDCIEIPRVLAHNQQNVTLAIDGITVNSLQCL